MDTENGIIDMGLIIGYYYTPARGTREITPGKFNGVNNHVIMGNFASILKLSGILAYL